ncbi:hypothetical protein RCH10_005228 [Variovorax sp. GrIS 2.14]|uniref:DUF6361 family protein n=1 Tax=Variovorax sp. GrIS 2.14 TaxID=3071709 RepID=UPI0038F7CCAF
MGRLGWVDFSSDDRDRVRDVLALLKEAGTLDELGIGQVRDAFSDAMFPGLSTIQTRARYFLAVPKLLLDWAELPDAKRRKKPLPEYLARAENDLARVLKANHERLGISPTDIIGHTAVATGGVERRPSSTYWIGLRAFGIVDTKQSLAEFCREWRRDHHAHGRVEADDGADDADHRFETKVRRPPSSHGPLRDTLTLDLNKKEAAFLETRIRDAKGLAHSVMAQLLSSGLAAGALSGETTRFGAFAQWAHGQKTLSAQSRETIAAADQFSRAVEGAHIVFNSLMARRFEITRLAKETRTRFRDWRADARAADLFHAEAPDVWLSAAVHGQLKVRGRTRDFLVAWNDAMRADKPMRFLEDLVEAQAKGNKKERSLLLRGPQQASSWFGMEALDYRWQTARRMLKDITEPAAC